MKSTGKFVRKKPELLLQNCPVKKYAYEIFYQNKKRVRWIVHRTYLSSQELVEDRHFTARGGLFYRGFYRGRCNIALILIIVISS